MVDKSPGNQRASQSHGAQSTLKFRDDEHPSPSLPCAIWIGRKQLDAGTRRVLPENRDGTSDQEPPGHSQAFNGIRIQIPISDNSRSVRESLCSEPCPYFMIFSLSSLLLEAVGLAQDSAEVEFHPQTDKKRRHLALLLSEGRSEERR